MSIYSSLATQIVDFGTKNSNPRMEPITKITIHHMAVVGADAATVARGHRDGSQQASANYYIGNDGTICGGVSEDRRAWTSGSSQDYVAITFEVANCKGEPNWEISDKAYKSMIALAADICKRYGITPHFTGTKEGTLTCHYMFQATACPGPYLKNLHANGNIERDILNALGEQQIAPVQTAEEQIWNYLRAKKNANMLIDKKTQELLADQYGSFSYWLNTRIEQTVRGNKIELKAE